MRRVYLGIAVTVMGGAACFGRGQPEVASTATLTSASSTAGESVSDRIARAVCVHEVECGRVRDPDMCIDTSRMRTATELSAWTCDPESARVAAEQCLVELRRQPCSHDLSTRENVCLQNGGCAIVESDRPAASR